MDYKELLIHKDKTILDALKQLDQTAKKILFLIDENSKLIGSLTDGDVRRYILKTGTIEGKVSDVCNRETFKCFIGEDRKKIIEEAKNLNIKYIPVVSDINEIVEIIILEETDVESKIATLKPLNIPVVIMAGGFGTRLEPFTRVLPKPLVPVGEKTLLEIIMEKFYQYGISEFWLSVNYKAYIIKSYLSELNLPYQINYIQEDKPLGTAGSLYLLKEKIKSESFILTNCDTILDIDYFSLLDTHNKQKNDITMVVSAQEFKIPYGICEISDGEVVDIKEKPSIKNLVNTGVYVINTNIIKLIPDNQFFNATDLIIKAKQNGKTVKIYPVSGDSWIDVGHWEEYRKALERIKI